VRIGGVIRLDVWDGWTNLINYALNGHAKRFLYSLSKVEKLAQYQCRVGLYIAAHFGHSDLASQLTSKKSPTSVDPGEAVGMHPAREWCHEHANHVEMGKAPVHIAAQIGNLNILRIFVANNIR